VVVRTFPDTGGRWQVSVDGGFEPRWRADGRELFFIGPDRRLMAAPVQPARRSNTPRPCRCLRRVYPASAIRFVQNYTVTRNGQRFLIKTVADNSTPTSITVVTNWLELLKK